MRIALRPSGGRGDYELAGSYGQLHASDLLEKRFFYQLTPALTIDGMASAHRLAGKPRIRPEDGRHPYVIISSILLMPAPRRELSRTSQKPPALRASTYTVAGIDVDVLADDAHSVTFAPTSVWLRSRGGVLNVDYSERMAVITALWNAAELRRSEIAKLVNEHRKSAVSGDHDRIAASANAIQKHYETEEDVLPLLLRDFGLPDSGSLAYAGISTTTEGFESEDDYSSPAESKRERTRKWRMQADRGPGAREFSVDVREAYHYRCLFSGEHFPKFPELDSAGVDGAHILPWSTHELNSVPNGLCLCKLCHWAFDNDLLHLDFDDPTNEYVLSIPGNIEKAALKAKFDLVPFQKNSGRIDKARLPKNRGLWPSPKYIRELNAN